MRNALEIVEVDNRHLEEILRRVEHGEALDEKDAKLIRTVCESYVYVTGLVKDKDTSIRRLRQLFFGARTEKTKAVLERNAAAPDSDPDPDAPAQTEGAGQ